MPQETTPTAEAAPSTQEGIQPGLAARAEAMNAVATARENLGHVAAGHEVHQDMHGNLLTHREVAEVRANGNQEDRRI